MKSYLHVIKVAVGIFFLFGSGSAVSADAGDRQTKTKNIVDEKIPEIEGSNSDFYSRLCSRSMDLFTSSCGEVNGANDGSPEQGAFLVGMTYWINTRKLKLERPSIFVDRSLGWQTKVLFLDSKFRLPTDIYKFDDKNAGFIIKYGHGENSLRVSSENDWISLVREFFVFCKGLNRQNIEQGMYK